MLGIKWDISRYKQSELKICDNGRLEIRGNMKIYTGCSIDICPNATLSLGSGYINNGAVIAANSLVNRNVPPKTLVAGVPAKIVKENVLWK